MLLALLSHSHEIFPRTPALLVNLGKTRVSRTRPERRSGKQMSRRQRRRLEAYEALTRDAARIKEITPDSSWVSLDNSEVESSQYDSSTIDTPGVSSVAVAKSEAENDEGEDLAEIRMSDAEKIDALRSKNGHKVKSWKDCKSTLYTVVDNYDGKVQDQYTTVWYDFSKSATTGHAPLSVEHIVPKSVVQRFTEVVQDLHNLIPVERNLNSRRSSYPYGPGNCSTNQSCLQSNKMLVRDGIKGFIARSVIYVFIMYEKKLKATNQRKWNINAVGNMKMLVDWCLTFEPTDYEKNRNDKIEDTQGNRNPFIDDTKLCKLALTIK